MSGSFTFGTRVGSNGRASHNFDNVASGRQKCTVPFMVFLKTFASDRLQIWGQEFESLRADTVAAVGS
jgi:hypothetical protein